MKIDLTVGGYILFKERLLLIHHRKLDKWLPVGGHIELDETPDDALKREIFEETNLHVRILGVNELPLTDSVKANLAVPFHVNVHNVGDHDHVGLFYICEVKDPEELIINDEVIQSRWFTKKMLNGDCITEEIRVLSLKAIEEYKRLTS